MGLLGKPDNPNLYPFMKQGLRLLAMVSEYVSSLQLADISMELTKIWRTVKPHPEAHMDMILFEVFLKSIDLIPQQITMALFILNRCHCTTVEPRYNEVLGTMKITLLYIRFLIITG